MSARVTDEFYDYHRPLTDRMAQVLASDAKTPEELCMEAEEASGLSIIQKARGELRKVLQRVYKSAHPQRRILKKLSPKDRETLLATHGMGLSSYQIAKIAGVSRQAVNKRQASAQKRVDWMTGPGRLFNGTDLHRDFQYVVAPKDLMMLKLVWALKSFTEAANRMGDNQKLVRTRFRALHSVRIRALAEDNPERYGKYMEGFAALRVLIAKKVVKKRGRFEPTFDIRKCGHEELHCCR